MKFLLAFLILLSSEALAEGCDENWTHFGTKCYRLFREAVNQYEARDHCMNLDAMLTSVHSEEENDFILNLSENSGTAAIWIGGQIVNRNPIEVKWWDGSDYDFTRFKGVLPHKEEGFIGVEIPNRNPEKEWYNIDPNDRDYNYVYVCSK